MPLESAIMAESENVAGLFLLMEGADPARGVLDEQYATVAASLREQGWDVELQPFDSNLTGLVLDGLVTGTSSLETTIEGNLYRPGSIVDNVTSFEPVPQNFEMDGESQVSIARWVSMGVAGVHGTTHEPLNSCFPDRQFWSTM